MEDPKSASPRSQEIKVLAAGTAKPTDSMPVVISLQFLPGDDYEFKKTGNRCCHAEWFKTWTWLHYNETQDAVLCFTCTSAIARNLLPSREKRSETKFTEVGFRTWKKGPEKFRDHEKSEFHLMAVEKIVASQQPGRAVLLSIQLQRQQEDARKVLSVIFSSAKYLAGQGFPFRGDQHKDGAFYNLVKERAADVPQVKGWLQRRDTWMSDNIQNEILQLFAHKIQASIAREASQSRFVGLTADGTTDISGMEQFALCIQYVNANLEPRNEFLGFYQPPNNEGETLATCIIDVQYFCDFIYLWTNSLATLSTQRKI